MQVGGDMATNTNQIAQPAAAVQADAGGDSDLQARLNALKG